MEPVTVQRENALRLAENRKGGKPLPLVGEIATKDGEKKFVSQASIP